MEDLGDGVTDGGDAAEEDDGGESFAGFGEAVVAVADGGECDEGEEEGLPEGPSLDERVAEGSGGDDGAEEEGWPPDRGVDEVPAF